MKEGKVDKGFGSYHVGMYVDRYMWMVSYVLTIQNRGQNPLSYYIILYNESKHNKYPCFGMQGQKFNLVKNLWKMMWFCASSTWLVVSGFVCMYMCVCVCVCVFVFGWWSLKVG
jgi:hypothetical protein